ncbi:MAG: hypothetical protein ACJ71Y_16315, partial [Blastococcus sp.]
EPVSDRSRRSRVRLLLALAGLGVVLVVGSLVVDRRESPDRQPSSPPSAGRPVSSSELQGEWSGRGTATQCAGFDRCDGARTITLTIDCSGKRCEVTAFDPSYGRPPLHFADGHYRAVGPLPAAVAPTCGGAPTSTAAWRLDVTVQDGRLTGSYAESTVQSFDCGATGVAWDVVLDRR